MARLTFDENELTIGDLEDFEDVTGESVTKALKGKPQKDDEGNLIRDEKGRPVTEVELSARSLKALIWIASRKDNPDFTLDDARNVKITELEIIRASDEDEAPEADPKD
jgi:hypothetical protein